MRRIETSLLTPSATEPSKDPSVLFYVHTNCLQSYGSLEEYRALLTLVKTLEIGAENNKTQLHKAVKQGEMVCVDVTTFLHV